MKKLVVHLVAHLTMMGPLVLVDQIASSILMMYQEKVALKACCITLQLRSIPVCSNHRPMVSDGMSPKVKIISNTTIFYTGNYSGIGSVESNSGSGLPTIDEISGLGSSSSGCPLEMQMCLPSRVCGGSASVERGFTTGFTHPDEPSCISNSTNSFKVITEQKEHGIRMNDDCDVTEPYL